jgi:predicted nuclease of predicted toxin-antitoxin system
MRILLDECIPRPLARHLSGHDVSTVPQMGWASTTNGALLKLAESQFETFVTVDKGIRYQQNLRSATLGFIVLRARSNRLEDLLPLVADILTALGTIKPGDIIQIEHR